MNHSRLKLGVLLSLLLCLFAAVSVPLAQAATVDDCRYDCPPSERVYADQQVQQQDITESPSAEIYRAVVENYPPDPPPWESMPARLSSRHSFGDDVLDAAIVVIVVLLVLSALILLFVLINELEKRSCQRDYLEWTHEHAKPFQFVGSDKEIDRAITMVAGKWKDEAEHYADQTKKDVGDDRYEVTLYVPLEAEDTMYSLLEAIG